MPTFYERHKTKIKIALVLLALIFLACAFVFFYMYSTQSFPLNRTPENHSLPPGPTTGERNSLGLQSGVDRELVNTTTRPPTPPAPSSPTEGLEQKVISLIPELQEAMATM